MLPSVVALLDLLSFVRAIISISISYPVGRRARWLAFRWQFRTEVLRTPHLSVLRLALLYMDCLE